MKVSEVNLDFLKNYLHVSHAEDDTLLGAILTASKSYIQGYTGLSSETLDSKEEISIALLVLCSEMYENRLYSVDSGQENPVVKTILHMYATNNL
mgnify:CR=1 FL=1